MKLLENKTALITGASRGIGAAAAKKLADAGFLVLVHYHRAAAAAAQIAAETGGAVEPDSPAAFDWPEEPEEPEEAEEPAEPDQPEI